jgi:hypothetical protein
MIVSKRLPPLAASVTSVSSAVPASEAVLSSLLESLPPQAEAAKVIANNVASNRHMVFFRIC